MRDIRNIPLYAPVAQLNRASGFYPVCRGFESLLAYQQLNRTVAQYVRKVRAPQDKIVDNVHPGRPANKCHRNIPPY